MTVGPAVAVFVVGAVVSLGTSWVLVTRLERVGERLGFSEASLGMVAALAADTPEITASITAIAHHQQTVGAGVVSARTSSISQPYWVWAPLWLDESTCTEEPSSWAAPLR